MLLKNIASKSITWCGNNMKTDLLDLYIEYNKVYDKYINRLMKLSNKKLIESTKQEFEQTANDYINKLTDNDFYIDNIRKNISTINENF